MPPSANVGVKVSSSCYITHGMICMLHSGFFVNQKMWGIQNSTAALWGTFKSSSEKLVQKILSSWQKWVAWQPAEAWPVGRLPVLIKPAILKRRMLHISLVYSLVWVKIYVFIWMKMLSSAMFLREMCGVYCTMDAGLDDMTSMNILFLLVTGEFEKAWEKADKTWHRLFVTKML